MVSKINSMGIIGVSAFSVSVETDISLGLPTFDIVGLPDTSVKEARNRVRSVIKNQGLSFPKSRITVNLAPADIKKAGSLYDLPILISILAASNQLSKINFGESVFIGELSLLGELNGVNGVLPMLIEAKKLGFKNAFIPKSNAEEGSIVEGISVFAFSNLKELLIHVLKIKTSKPQPTIKIEEKINLNFGNLDFSQVKGQVSAKRAIEIAVAGMHNILLIGPPGSGKSMLAKRIPSIFPTMTKEEAIDVTKIYSISGKLPKGMPLVCQRPFRSPHHTISTAGMTGGGSIPTPGEITLAHNGVLFLDELPEFSRSTIEILRQPMEENTITISRVKTSLTYPCNVMFVCAMNPCPCGFFGSNVRRCTCSRKAIAKYLSKVSGPLLDRLDLHIEVPALSFENLSSSAKCETSEIIRKRVGNAREIQIHRQKSSVPNSKIDTDVIQKVCILSDEAKNIMKIAFESLGFSGRGYNKVLKIARTIADLDSSEIINENHVAEAIQYRSLDRKYWNGLQRA